MIERKIDGLSANQLGVGRGDIVRLADCGIGDPEALYLVVKFRDNQQDYKGELTLQRLDRTQVIFTSPDTQLLKEKI